jgi:hypothetical protein
MGNRVIDLLIVLVLVAAVAIAAYAFVLPNLSEEDDKDDSAFLAATETMAPTATPQPTPDTNLSTLTDEQLRALLPGSDKLGALLSATLNPEDYRHEAVSTIDAEVVTEWPAAAEEFQYLYDVYGDYPTIGTEYTPCKELNLPIGRIDVSVEQHSDADLLRQFFDDPKTRGLITALLYERRDAEAVHGWSMTRADQDGSCYTLEDQHELIFEQWGLLFDIVFEVEAGSDPAPIWEIINRIASLITRQVDTLDAAASLPATPVPSGAPSVRHTITLHDVERGVPPSEWLEEDSPWTLNQNVSRSYTLAEYIAAYENLDMPELAGAIAQAGAEHGMVGQVVRIWDTGADCPSIVGLVLEIDIALFETATGAQGYMNDAALQQAWRNTGNVLSFTPTGDQVQVLGRYPNHRCGSLQVVEKKFTYDRLLITVSLTGYDFVDQQEIAAVVDNMATMMGMTLGLVGVPEPQ